LHLITFFFKISKKLVIGIIPNIHAKGKNLVGNNNEPITYKAKKE